MAEPTAEVQEKIDAQRAYCKKMPAPYFAPFKGVCWGCGEQIFNKISLESAGSRLITGCPCCSRTYCD